MLLRFVLCLLALTCADVTSVRNRLEQKPFGQPEQYGTEFYEFKCEPGWGTNC